MSGSIPQSFISSLNDRVDLYTLINSRVPLKKSGSGYKACCPFHEEKTPSFNVQPEKGYYHCFGCGAHGDAISFLKDYDNLSFVDAIESLARIAGVEVPRDEVAKERHDKSQRLVTATKFAHQYFLDSLQSHMAKSTALAYLEQRGISSEMISLFGLGFAPPEKSGLYRKADNSTRNSLIALKLVSDSYSSPFDLFRNRLMFPIRNIKGHVIAFGGRTLGEDKAKYINSPESDIFHKSNEVYGLYEARKASRQLDHLIVVEGYLDVISLAQFGITNAVATLGTATNDDNLRALLRHVHKLVFCFDGDQAGRNAAKKAMENSLPLLEDGIDIRFLLLPQGEDPDTLVRKEGGKKMRARIEGARPLSSFLIDIYSDGLDLKLPEHKGILKKHAEEQIEKIASQTIKRNIKSEIYKLTNPQRNENWQKGKFNNQSSGNNHFRKKESGTNDTGYYSQKTDISFRVETGARICLGLYFKPSLKEEVIEKLSLSQSNPELRTLFEFLSYLNSENIITRDDLLLSLATNMHYQEKFKHLFKSIEHFPEEEVAILEAQGEINQMQIRSVEQKITEILNLENGRAAISDQKKQELKDLYVKKQTLRNLNDASS